MDKKQDTMKFLCVYRSELLLFSSLLLLCEVFSLRFFMISSETEWVHHHIEGVMVKIINFDLKSFSTASFTKCWESFMIRGEEISFLNEQRPVLSINADKNDSKMTLFSSIYCIQLRFLVFFHFSFRFHSRARWIESWKGLNVFLISYSLFLRVSFGIEMFVNVKKKSKKIAI